MSRRPLPRSAIPLPPRPARGGISPASQSVLHGATTSFTVTPTSGYLIGTVNGCGGSLAGSTYTTGPITAACTVNASFTLITYTVTATAGTGGSISPPTRSVIPGATTTFTVTPTSGYRIGTVSGCGGTLAGSTYTTGTITTACTVSASFTALPKYTLTITKSGTGTVASAPAGISCGYTCRAAFVSGTSVTLTATAGAGHQFASWTGCTSVSGNSCTVAMTGAKSVKATFTALPKYTLAVTKSGTGSVASAPSGISCGTTCSAKSALFASGATVTLTATPITGRRFKNWSGACTGVATSCAVPMTQAQSVTAVFQ